MPITDGRTIASLIRVDTIKGTEIVPLSLYDEELGKQVTRGITLDDLFKLIYDKMKQHEEDFEDYKQTMSETIERIDNDATESSREAEAEMKRLDEELAKTNQQVAYTAMGCLSVHSEIYDVTSYSKEQAGKLHVHVDELESYTHENVGRLSYETSYAAAVNDEQSSYISTLYHAFDQDSVDDWGDPADDMTTWQK